MGNKKMCEMTLLVIIVTTVTGRADQMTFEQAQTAKPGGFGFGSGLFTSFE